MRLDINRLIQKVWVHNHNTFPVFLQPFLLYTQQYKGIPGRDALKTNTLKCKGNLIGLLSSKKPKNKVESAKVKTDCRLYFSLLFSKGSVAIYRLGGGEGRFLEITWITEGTMGEAVVANRVKKAGHKKIACQRGGWGGGGMRILGSGKFYDESSKISSLSSPPPQGDE